MREHEYWLGPVLLLVGLVWLGLMALLCLGGICDGVWGRQGCGHPVHRIEYVVPGYRLGCWLGGVPE